MMMLMPTMRMLVSLLGLSVTCLLVTTKRILKTIIDYFVGLHIFEGVRMAVDNQVINKEVLETVVMTSDDHVMYPSFAFWIS